MDQKMHQPRSKASTSGNVFLFILMFTLLGCSGSSEPPVEYEDFESLKKDCPSLLSNQQKASISGPLNVHESTICITDQDGEYCKIFLGYQENSLDIWMKTGGKNGMDHLPDPYLIFDLVVHADDGDEFTAYDMVTLTLDPFNGMEDGKEVCSFRVKTILRSKIVASENQPGEGTVTLSIPANVFWVDTGIYVNQGQRLMIFPGIGGNYNLQDDDPDWNAYSDLMWGVTDMLCDNNCIINGENYGMLVAKINEGQPFLVTRNTSDFIIPASGEFYLTVNDCVGCYENNTGTFDVVIDLHNVP